MASEDEVRDYVQWYFDALSAAGQAIINKEDVGEVIRKAVDGLSDAQARNVLQVMIGHQAQLAVKGERRKWD